MIDLSSEVSGLKDFEKSLDEIAKQIDPKKAASILTSSLRIGAKIIHMEMLESAPVSTAPLKGFRLVTNRAGEKVKITPGFLKSRIKIKTATNKKARSNKKFGNNDISIVQVGVFKVPYIVQVEFGTARQAPTPFIRLAFENNSRPAVVAMKKALGKKIIAATKKHKAKGQ